MRCTRSIILVASRELASSQVDQFVSSPARRSSRNSLLGRMILLLSLSYDKECNKQYNPEEQQDSEHCCGYGVLGCMHGAPP
jgi:hypothetical protein